MDEKQTSEGTGSGFILDTQGHIVTNNHVVADADQVEVVLANSLSYTAKIVGADQYYDLAVLQIDAPGVGPTAEAILARVIARQFAGEAALLGVLAGGAA